MTVPLGEIVHFVIDTGMGIYVLPARVIAMNQEEASLRVYTDKNGSEWIVNACYSESKEVGTWHKKG